MTVSAVVTAHATNPKEILRQLGEQTRRPSELIVLVSGQDDLFTVGGKLLDHYELAVWSMVGQFFREPDLNDWGNAKRDKGLKLAQSDYVGFFNADDEYDRTYLEKMMAEAERTQADIIYCDFWSHLIKNVIVSNPHVGAISSGSFLVKTKTGQTIGYPHEGYTADGRFIEELVKRGASTTHVPEVLYRHL